MIAFGTLLALNIYGAMPPLQSWDREILDGMSFRQEVRTDPPVLAHGLLIDPKQLSAKSWLAGGNIYEPGATKGRGTVSSMVRESGAAAGINGDFFQFGEDPGGDPDGFVITAGEFISQPGSAYRGSAVGWGPDLPLRLLTPKSKASLTLPNGKILPIGQINGRPVKDQISFSNSRAGYIYSPTPAKLVKLVASKDSLLPTDTLKMKVKSVGDLAGVEPITNGEAVLVSTGSAELASLVKIGDEISINLLTEGDLQGVTEAMGGGPILLRDGEIENKGASKSFSETRHPRSLVGRTSDGKIWYVVIDGRQTMSVGASLQECAELMKRWGCVDALNLDGGGSSAINALGMTLNRPSGGVERYVANGIMMFTPKPFIPREISLNYRLRVQDGRVEVQHVNGGIVAPSKCVFSCQGAAWIDQTGTLHKSGTGMAKVAVLVNGVIVRKAFDLD